jgi:uncharacterized protein YheU (UPF0270 family)
MPGGDSRFFVNLQEGKDDGENSTRLVQEVLRLTNQVGAAQIPISLQQGQPLPQGMLPGQPVILWNPGQASQLMVWTGEQLE